MEERDGLLITRWVEPSIVSVIFAPRPENESFTTIESQDLIFKAGRLDSFPVGGPMWQRILVENVHVAIQRHFVLLYDQLREAFAQSSSVAMQDARRAELSALRDDVPGRNFPFASHIDLLSGVQEGLSFDADDYKER